MGFENLLGNARLKENLKVGLARERLSHFYLISGPEGSGKRTLARLLAAAFVCAGQDKPCLQCPACRKIMAGTHPDFITVEDPDHKTVPVKQVREVREDMYIRPNEADKKVYLFPQELGTEGQNALLKVLEEPPAYAVTLLLTNNPETILTTVRSRCTELTLLPLSREALVSALEKDFPQADAGDLEAAITRSGGYLGQAKALLQAGAGVSPQTDSFVSGYTQKNALELLTVLTAMGSWGKDRLISELSQWLCLLQQALSCRSGMTAASAQVRTLAQGRSSRELLQSIRHLQKAIQYAQGNVSTAAICGWLTRSLV